jgi:hypothetical protein
MLAVLTIFWDRPMLLLGLLLVGLPGFFARRAAVKGLPHSRWSVALRLIAIVGIILAIAGTQLSGLRGPGGPWLVMTDISGSTRIQQNTRITFDDTRQVRRVHFSAYPSVPTPGQTIDDTQTNMGLALKLATDQVAQGASGIVIQTDGQFNAGTWRDEAKELGQTGIPVVIVPMDSPPADARILSFAGHRDGDQARLRARLYATEDMNVMARAFRLRPTLEGIDEQMFSLPANKIDHTGFSDNLDPQHTGVYEFSFIGSDPFPENNSARALLPPTERRILVLAQDPAPWGAAISQAGLPVTERTFQGCPPDPSLLSDFSAVVLVDSSGQGLERLQQSALEQFVRTGGGLVLIGTGPYAAPADTEEPLNQVSALLADPSRRRPLDLVVLLDRSGSMGEVLPNGESPFDKARQATEALRDQLAENDALRLVAFADTARTVYDSEDGAIDWAAMHDAIETLDPAGGTNAGAALELGASLGPREGKHRVVLLVSDLDTETFDPNTIADALTQADATLAMVKVYASELIAGPYGTPAGMAALHDLAQQLRAPSVTLRADFTVEELSGLFGQFVEQGRGEPIRRGEFAGVTLEVPDASSSTSMPPLDAYIVSRTTTDDAVVLSAIGTDPVLAARSVGLGRSFTLAVPLEMAQNNQWQRSTELGAFLHDMLEWARNRQEATLLAGGIETLPTGDRALFVSTDPGARITPPEGMQMHLFPTDDRYPPVVLTPTGRGTFAARIPSGWDGEFVEVRDAAGMLLFTKSTATIGAGEFLQIGPHWKNLKELAELTGGTLLDNRSVLTQAEAPREIVTCWPGLMGMAIVAMLLDWMLSNRRNRTASTNEG